jgi:hypothetical protein
MSAPQHEEFEDGQDVKNQHGKDDVVEQLSITAGDAKNTSPDHLHYKGNRRGLVGRMQFSHALENNPFLAMA